MATHSSVLAWRIPGTGEPGGLLSMGSHSQTQLKQFSSSSRSSSKMSIFNLAISCLTISNLPWFMNLIFQIPMQYYSLQHRNLLLSPVPFTTGSCVCFGSIPSFFLELFLHRSPVTYWAPNQPGEFIFQCLIFLPFHTVHGVLKARILKWLDIPFLV